jgi:hypothetical protein
MHSTANCDQRECSRQPGSFFLHCVDDALHYCDSQQINSALQVACSCGGSVRGCRCRRGCCARAIALCACNKRIVSGRSWMEADKAEPSCITGSCTQGQSLGHVMHALEHAQTTLHCSATCQCQRCRFKQQWSSLRLRRRRSPVVLAFAWAPER